MNALCKVCTKEYYDANRDKILKRKKEFRGANPESTRDRYKEYYSANREVLKERAKRYRDANKEVIRERKKKYREEHKDEINERMRGYSTNRKKTDPLYVTVTRLRSLIGNSFKYKGFSKKTRTFILLGCGAIELLDKWGVTSIPEGYHIDHICPMAQARTIEEAEKLCHHSNLQLLKEEENCSKQDSKTPEGEALCLSLLGRPWID